MEHHDKSDEIWNTEFFQRHAEAAVQRAALELRDQLMREFGGVVLSCESPLEAAFGAWWTALGRLFISPYDLRYQVPVEAHGANYRLDLVLVPAVDGFYRLLRNHPLCPKVAIELDGHEFHERTKEQVEARNRRDRALQTSGWVVLHVSGSEFHRDPYKCISSVIKDARLVSWPALEAALIAQKRG